MLANGIGELRTHDDERTLADAAFVGDGEWIFLVNRRGIRRRRAH